MISAFFPDTFFFRCVCFLMPFAFLWTFGKWNVIMFLRIRSTTETLCQKYYVKYVNNWFFIDFLEVDIFFSENDEIQFVNEAFFPTTLY